MRAHAARHSFLVHVIQIVINDSYHVVILTYQMFETKSAEIVTSRLTSEFDQTITSDDVTFDRHMTRYTHPVTLKMPQTCSTNVMNIAS